MQCGETGLKKRLQLKQTMRCEQTKAVDEIEYVQFCSELTLEWLHHNIVYKGSDSKIEGCIADKVLGSRKVHTSKNLEKTKKIKKKQKKTKNKKLIFQRSWKWKRLGKSLKILFFFFVFLVFFVGFSTVFDFSLKGLPQRVSKYFFFVFPRLFHFSLRDHPQRVSKYVFLFLFFQCFFTFFYIDS